MLQDRNSSWTKALKLILDLNLLLVKIMTKLANYLNHLTSKDKYGVNCIWV